MRTLTIIALLVASASAYAQTPPSPATAPTATAPASAEAKPAPQCWHADESKFFDVGTKTSISGVNVECKATSDGKAAQWVGSGKH